MICRQSSTVDNHFFCVFLPFVENKLEFILLLSLLFMMTTRQMANDYLAKNRVNFIFFVSHYFMMTIKQRQMTI